MAIVIDGDFVSVEYQIPDEIDSRIPECFYFAMAGELCSIHGPSVFDKIYYSDEEKMYENCDNSIAVSEKSSVDESVVVGEIKTFASVDEDGYYDLDTGTGGWYEALKMTCMKLDMCWLLDYWNSLEWYDSDIFDGIIEDRIIAKVVKSDDMHCNAYYQYLCDLDKNESLNKNKIDIVCKRRLPSVDVNEESLDGAGKYLD